MSSESETIEDKRRKNVLDNQNFLQSLHLFNVRDNLKSSVQSVTTVSKPSRKKINRKDNIDPSEVRRSSRIESMLRTDYHNKSTIDDEDFVLSSEETSNDEEDDLSTAFTTKVDKDWQPVHGEKLPISKSIRPVRKAAKTMSGGVKIFWPNTGLEASKVISKTNSHRSHMTRKINVAISSSSEEDN